MYYKLIKFVPVEYGNDTQHEMAVANRKKDLVEHLRCLLNKRSGPPIDADYSFENEFGYTSKRPRNEPYYQIEQVPNGMLLFTIKDI